MAKIGKHIHCVVWKLNAAPCDAVCVLFSAKGLVTHHGQEQPT